MLIDPHSMSADHSVSVDLEDVSKDGGILAYSIRRGGADETEIHLLDVNARTNLPDVLPNARYFGVSFLPDKSGFYYSLMSADSPHVRFHRIGIALRDIGRVRDDQVKGEISRNFGQQIARVELHALAHLQTRSIGFCNLQRRWRNIAGVNFSI